MAVEHARPGVAHHGADPRAHLWPVAVHRAARARGFALLEGTLVQAELGIRPQRVAFGAQPVIGTVLTATVEAAQSGSDTRS